jgi:hypothetical protein
MLHLAEAKLEVASWSPPGNFAEWLAYLRDSERGATGTALSDYLENALLDHVLGKTTYTGPTTTYPALYTVTPGDAGGGTEVTGGTYARVAVTNNTTNWPNASGGSKSNGVDIDFGTATANWGTVVAVAILDASSGGNFMFYGTLTTPKTVNSGDAFKFNATKLVCALD